MRDQFRVSSPLCWTAALLAALASPALLLLWPSTLMWWLSGLLVVPVTLLAFRNRDTSSDDIAGGPGDGPWSAPDF